MSKATTKWQQRAREWSGSGIGLQYSAMVYDVFCASVLYFLAQMEPISDDIVVTEKRTMLMLAKGPKEWACPSDLWRMGEQCGVGRSFHCVRLVVRRPCCEHTILKIGRRLFVKAYSNSTHGGTMQSKKIERCFGVHGIRGHSR